MRFRVEGCDLILGSSSVASNLKAAMAYQRIACAGLSFPWGVHAGLLPHHVRVCAMSRAWTPGNRALENLHVVSKIIRCMSGPLTLESKSWSCLAFPLFQLRVYNCQY